MREQTAYTIKATQLPVMSFKHNLRTRCKSIIVTVIKKDSLIPRTLTVGWSVNVI